MLRPGIRGRRIAVALAAVSVGALTAASGAWAVAQPIVAADDFYTAATYTMDQGDKPAFQNTGVNTHDATARGNGPDGEPLFESPSMGTGTYVVNGTQYLTAGTYAFYCTVHPLSMSGNLAVSGAGTPVARPKIDVTVSSGSLSKAAGKGKLPVKVAALTQSDGVRLSAKLGKATIATQGAFNLVAGQTRKLTLKLSKSGKNKLKNRKSAKVSVTGTVPFGAPDTGKRTLK